MIALLLALCLLQANSPAPQPQTGTPEDARLTTADPFLTLMADPEAAAIIIRMAPAYIRLLEQQVTPPPSAEVTLNDFVRIPETGVTEETLKAINAELAKLPPRRQ